MQMESTFVLRPDPARVPVRVAWLCAGLLALIPVLLAALWLTSQMLDGAVGLLRDPSLSLSGVLLFAPFLACLALLVGLGGRAVYELITQLRGRDEIRLTESGLDCARFRGLHSHRRVAPWSTVQGVSVAAGTPVMIRTDPGVIWQLTRMGTPLERDALAAAVARWVPPAPTYLPDGVLPARPPHLPHGWYVREVPPPAGDLTSPLLLTPGPLRQRLEAIGFGLGVAILLSGLALLTLHDRIHERSTWILLGGAILVVTALISWSVANRAPGWLIGNGELLVGEVRPGGTWLRPPSAVSQLRVVVQTGSDSEVTHHKLQAMQRGRWMAMYEGSTEGAGAQRLGAWLAVKADIPFTDFTRIPGPPDR